MFSDATDALQYCYKGSRCDTVKANDAGNSLISQAECCALSDAHGWGVGNQRCEQCIKTEGRKSDLTLLFMVMFIIKNHRCYQ